MSTMQDRALAKGAMQDTAIKSEKRIIAAIDASEKRILAAIAKLTRKASP